MSVDVKDIYCDEVKVTGSCIGGVHATLVNVEDSELEVIIRNIARVNGPEFITDCLDEFLKRGKYE
jgi:hypothetical protein